MFVSPASLEEQAMCHDRDRLCDGGM